MIGNLVMVDCDYYKDVKGVPFKLTGISERPPHPTIPDEKYSATLTDGRKIVAAWSNSLRPIPITAEWLEKFGFEYVPSNDWYFMPTPNDISITRNEIVYFDKDGSFRVFQGRLMRYVHELQNHFTINHKIKLQIK